MKKIVNIVLSLITVAQLSAQSLDSVDFKLENITDSLYLLTVIPNPSSGNNIVVNTDELKKRDLNSDSIMYVSSLFINYNPILITDLDPNFFHSTNVFINNKNHRSKYWLFRTKKNICVFTLII